MKSRRKVVLLGPIAPPPFGPAVKNQILLEALERRGIDVITINTLGGRARFLRVLPAVVWHCIRIPRIFLSVSSTGRLLTLPFLQILKVLRDLKIVLIPAGGTFADEIQAMPSLLQRFYLSLAARCTFVMPETEGFASKLRSLGLANVKVLPNFKPSYQDLAMTEERTVDETRIIFISRVRPRKGIDTLLRALDSLHKDCVFNLDIYGMLLDSYRDEFFDMVSDRDYAKYRGVLPISEVIPTISSYDLMVFPTVYEGEGFPGVLVDAAIAGLPVVATDFAYNSEIVRDGFNGLLVEPANVGDLASKIRLLIQDPELRSRLGKNNKLVSENYTVDTVVGGILLGELERMSWWEEGL